MAGVEHRGSAPGEILTPDKTSVELVSLAGGQIGRDTFQPGWRWSECIKPVVGTDSCGVEHIGYCISGAIHVRHDGCTGADVAGGEGYRIGPGHDAWVAGNEPFVLVEFQGAANDAKPS